MPQWRYCVHRWEDTETAIYTQSGWITQERRIAPIARIQTVDTHRGPIEQLFGLANVTVTTASAAGPLKIHGLSRADADRLVADLTATHPDRERRCNLTRPSEPSDRRAGRRRAAVAAPRCRGCCSCTRSSSCAGAIPALIVARVRRPLVRARRLLGPGRDRAGDRRPRSCAG